MTPAKGQALRSPGPGESRDAARRRHVDAINAYLQDLGHAPLRSYGDFSRGEVELIAPNGVQLVNPWYSLIGFDTINPDGTAGQFFLRFQARSAEGDAIIVLPMINEQLVFVYQHRPAAARWLTEAPRAFAKTRMELTIVDRKIHEAARACGLDRELRAFPLGVLARELTQLVVEDTLVFREVRLLDRGPQDSGFDTTEPEIWLVRMEIADPAKLALMRGTKAQKIRLYPIDEVRRRRKELGIVDALSKSALLSLYEHLGLI